MAENMNAEGGGGEHTFELNEYCLYSLVLFVCWLVGWLVVLFFCLFLFVFSSSKHDKENNKIPLSQISFAGLATKGKRSDSQDSARRRPTIESKEQESAAEKAASLFIS